MAAAASDTGTEAYPPTPNTRPGRLRRNTRKETKSPPIILATPVSPPPPPPPTLPEETKSTPIPRDGTAFASSPPSVPTKETDPPGERARNASASAIPGNTCPPVPPPAINRFSDKSFRSFHRDVREDPDRGQVKDERGSPVAQERQDHPLRREHLQAHHHVREGLHADHGGHPHREVLPERIAGAPADPKTHPDERHEAGAHGDDSREPELLPDDGEDVVRVHLREIEELLFPGSDSGPEKASVREGDQGLHHLVSRRLRLGKRVEERRKARHPVRFRGDRDDPPRNPQDAASRKQFPRESGDEQQRQERRGDDHRHAEVRLPEDQPHEDHKRRELREERPPSSAEILPSPVDGVGRIGKEGELGELGRLEGEDPEVDPAGRAVDRVPEPGNENEEEEHEGPTQEEQDVPAEDVVVDPGEEKSQGGSQHEEENLPLEIVSGVVPEPVGRSRGDRRGAVHHHGSQSHQDQRAESEDQVFVPFPDVHAGNLLTASRNASPRSSKLRNISKLEQAGESTTTSPSRAHSAAWTTASSREPASRMGTDPMSSRFILPCASPRRIAARAFRPRETRRGRKSTPLSFPPAMRTTGSGNPSRHLRTAPTLVPFESLKKETPRTSRTNSTRCGSPAKAERPSRTASDGIPMRRAAPIAAMAFSTFCSPRTLRSDGLYLSSTEPARWTISSPSRNTPGGSGRERENGILAERTCSIRADTSRSSAFTTAASARPWFRKIAIFAAA